MGNFGHLNSPRFTPGKAFAQHDGAAAQPRSLGRAHSSSAAGYSSSPEASKRGQPKRKTTPVRANALGSTGERPRS